ncbi:MAG: outer membrane beta-barrel protein [Chitinophagaceae bacterium]
MKKNYFLVAALCIPFIGFAQTDSTSKKPGSPEKNDTIRIGGMVIIKKGGKGKTDDSTTVHVEHRRRNRSSNISTNWGIVDLGFANYTDNTDYTSMQAQQFAPGSNKDWFNLRNGKSVNVNIWFFMQRLNLVKHVVNLKYGLGLELNNYRYEEDIRYKVKPVSVYKDMTLTYSKNKLAADYLTIPLMLNFNFTPGKNVNKSFGFSAGASAGYLYASRQKNISTEEGKKKTKNDFDLRPYKLSYIAEVQLGPVKVYGSLATQSMFEKGLDQTPYNIGIRLSNW